MGNDSYTVTEEAVETMNNVSAYFDELISQLQQSINQLQTTFNDNQAGCGAHAESIQALIDYLNMLTQQASNPIKILALKLIKASLKRRDHIDTDNYKKGL